MMQLSNNSPDKIENTKTKLEEVNYFYYLYLYEIDFPIFK